MDSIGNRNLKKKESFQVISTLDKGKIQRTHELTEVAYTYNLCQLSLGFTGPEFCKGTEKLLNSRKQDT